IGASDNSTRFFDLHRYWAKRSPLLISCVSSLVAETNERFTIIIWSYLFRSCFGNSITVGSQENLPFSPDQV
ncbi:MAG: hypothetical protein VYE62_07300, partial [Pseudomonadota bacterium]|nr:hypothetical protein [Pseudomonadota bacterium]